jgi:hypothetical protein
VCTGDKSGSEDSLNGAERLNGLNVLNHYFALQDSASLECASVLTTESGFNRSAPFKTFRKPKGLEALDSGLSITFFDPNVFERFELLERFERLFRC